MDVGVEEIRRWHLAKGWSDIGYHYVITRNGTLQTGRPEGEIGAHVHGYNARSLGICLVGGLDGNGQPANNFTAAQLRTLRAALKSLNKKYPGAVVLGHRDLSPDTDGDGIVSQHEWLKACPCFDVRSWFTGGNVVAGSVGVVIL